jgi:hypothetical protein
LELISQIESAKAAETSNITQFIQQKETITQLKLELDQLNDILLSVRKTSVVKADSVNKKKPMDPFEQYFILMTQSIKFNHLR